MRVDPCASFTSFVFEDTTDLPIYVNELAEGEMSRAHGGSLTFPNVLDDEQRDERRGRRLPALSQNRFSSRSLIPLCPKCRSIRSGSS